MEQKYRLWDGIHGKMIYDGFFIDSKGRLFFDCDPKGVDMSGKVRIYSHSLENHFTLIMFTGLKDKHGKPIYEGDMVKIGAGYGGDHFYNECVAVIKYDAPEFYPYNPKDKDGLVMQDECNYFKGFEIIGNIYENPELLTQQEA